jgi:endonuclease I
MQARRSRFWSSSSSALTLLLVVAFVVAVVGPLWTAAIVCAQPLVPLDNCNSGAYYDDFNLASEDMRSALADLSASRHRRQVPYTASADGDQDVWDALMDLDGNGTAVTLIYSGRAMSNELAGDAGSGWNREHLWPQSRGVYDSGPAFVDLHHLRPTEWGVNSARGNKPFGPCLDESAESCKRPAHEGAASDTEADVYNFLPPESVRGDIARALFYMDVRYNASNHDVDLLLTDCPGEASGTGLMGYLSQLLEWHQNDAVSDDELVRNEKACYWQGNRNPFVDFPNIVEDVYGADAVATRPYVCPPTPAPAAPAASSSSSPSPAADGGEPEPSPSGSDGGGSSSSPSSACSDALWPGSMAVIGINSMNPDEVGIVALADVPAGVTIYMIDGGWDGTTLRQNEGVVKYTFAEPFAAGQVLRYERQSDPAPWVEVSGTLAISMSGDSVLVFCAANDETALESPQLFVAGFSWSRNASAWLDLGNTESTGLPDELKGKAVGLDDNKGKNYVYIGPREGLSTSALLGSITDPDNWKSSATDRFDFKNLVFGIEGSRNNISAGSRPLIAGLTLLAVAISSSLAFAIEL